MLFDSIKELAQLISLSACITYLAYLLHTKENSNKVYEQKNQSTGESKQQHPNCQYRERLYIASMLCSTLLKTIIVS